MQVGLMMLMVTPCTDWYLVFTSIAKGNVALGASILPLNLLLQVVLLPVYLMIFYGGSVSIGGSSVILSIIIVLLVPLLASAVCKQWEGRRIGQNLVAKLREWGGDNAQLLFLCLAIIAMFASESKPLFEHFGMLLRMLIPMILFFAVNFVLIRWIGKKLKFTDYDLIPLNFTTLARNSPLSLATRHNI